MGHIALLQRTFAYAEYVSDTRRAATSLLAAIHIGRSEVVAGRW